MTHFERLAIIIYYGLIINYPPVDPPSLLQPPLRPRGSPLRIVNWQKLTGTFPLPKPWVWYIIVCLHHGTTRRGNWPYLVPPFVVLLASQSVTSPFAGSLFFCPLFSIYSKGTTVFNERGREQNWYRLKGTTCKEVEYGILCLPIKYLFKPISWIWNERGALLLPNVSSSPLHMTTTTDEAAAAVGCLWVKPGPHLLQVRIDNLLSVYGWTDGRTITAEAAACVDPFQYKAQQATITTGSSSSSLVD